MVCSCALLNHFITDTTDTQTPEVDSEPGIAYFQLNGNVPKRRLESGGGSNIQQEMNVIQGNAMIYTVAYIGIH